MKYQIISKWNKNKRKYGIYNGKTLVFGFKSKIKAKLFLRYELCSIK